MFDTGVNSTTINSVTLYKNNYVLPGTYLGNSQNITKLDSNPFNLGT